MLKILKTLAFSLIFLFLAFAIIGLFLPKTQHVERQIVINAPANIIFPYLNNLHKFNEWSPWAKIDPSTQYTFSGPDDGVGATMAWSSDNQNVGIGKQEILQSRPTTFVQTKLDFGMGEPVTAAFSLIESDEQTALTWSFDTTFKGFISPYFGLMFDKWVGEKYEEGLVDLKTIIEAK